MMENNFVHRDPKERRVKVLQYQKLDGARYKDPNTHSGPHLTMEATPGNEVKGRDQDLFFKLMADMMTRKDARDVSRPFEQNPTMI